MIDPFVCPCCGVDATKLRMLADYVDALHPDDPNPEVQDDLRRWADEIERATA